jgi:hypothetical protein
MAKDYVKDWASRAVKEAAAKRPKEEPPLVALTPNVNYSSEPTQQNKCKPSNAMATTITETSPPDGRIQAERFLLALLLGNRAVRRCINIRDLHWSHTLHERLANAAFHADEKDWDASSVVVNMYGDRHAKELLDELLLSDPAHGVFRPTPVRTRLEERVKNILDLSDFRDTRCAVETIKKCADVIVEWDVRYDEKGRIVSTGEGDIEIGACVEMIVARRASCEGASESRRQMMGAEVRREIALARKRKGFVQEPSIRFEITTARDSLISQIVQSRVAAGQPLSAAEVAAYNEMVGKP